MVYCVLCQELLHSITDECGDVCVCLSKRNKGWSLMSCHVNKIRILGFRGTIREVHMIKHFLDYLPSLKELEIVVEEKEDTMFGIPKWLDIVEETLKHFNETSSCNVIFWMHAFLYRRLTRKWSSRGWKLDLAMSFVSLGFSYMCFKYDLFLRSTWHHGCVFATLKFTFS